MNNQMTHQVAIIGAGPYGLAAAAHLRAADVQTCVFGQTMEFWENQMPAGMLLRSARCASHIADPQRNLTLDRYEATQQAVLSTPISLRDFVEYGRWFQQRVVPDLDRRRIDRIELSPKGYRLMIEDGEAVHVQRVVVATGISPFAWCPPQFDGLSPEIVSHSSTHRDLGAYAGQRTIVLGGGQSALESAALLHEAGAEVEVIMRQPTVRWLDQLAPWLKSSANPIRPLLYPSTDVGPPGLNLIVAAPRLFARLPRSLQERIAYRSIRPAGAGWLVPRLRAVRITTGRVVNAVTPAGQQVRLKLDDGTERRVDHVLLATGFRVNVSRYSFLAPELLRAVRVTDGYPNLTAGLESSLPGLHFLGAPGAYSFGPLCRFVSGTGYTARALTKRVIGKRTRRVEWLSAGIAPKRQPFRP
jgi:FAD-dependent urate hydroxylase